MKGISKGGHFLFFKNGFLSEGSTARFSAIPQDIYFSFFLNGLNLVGLIIATGLILFCFINSRFLRYSIVRR
jgi:hypothetical protein